MQARRKSLEREAPCGPTRRRPNQEYACHVYCLFELFYRLVKVARYASSKSLQVIWRVLDERAGRSVTGMPDIHFQPRAMCCAKHFTTVRLSGVALTGLRFGPILHAREWIPHLGMLALRGATPQASKPRYFQVHVYEKCPFPRVAPSASRSIAALNNDTATSK